MLITEGQLRRIIREELLREVRITPDNLPDGIKFRLFVSSTGGMIRASVYKHSVEFGEVVAHKVRNQDVPCYGAFEVRNSYSQFKGFGPILYDITMEAATELGGGLMSDRMSVQDPARHVWSYYQNNRPDVERLQLDSPEDDITKNVRFDNCNVMISKNLAGEDVSQWKDYPLSGVYRKPGMETVRRLMDMGKIDIKGMDI